MHKSSMWEKIITLLVVVVPAIAFVLTIANFWNGWVNWPSLALLVLFFLVSGFGVTIGFHRYFTHKSFETSRPVRYTLAIAGMMATEGKLFSWVVDHTIHHRHSDEDGDPHSPHHHGGGFWGPVVGAFHAHLGWIFSRSVLDKKYVGKLMEDKGLVHINSLFPLWVGLGLFLPALIGFIWTGSWWGVWLGFLWGGLIRILVVHHLTWSINSVCHIWGFRPFKTSDESRNNPFFGFFGLGEGWHNNHHAFPTSARHGLRWWEFDLTWWVIRSMQFVGLVWDVRVPTSEQVSIKLKGGVNQAA